MAGEVVGRNGDVQHLEPKVMDVLVELARAWPDVMERDSAIEVVWGGRPMADDGLARCIAALRKALGDSRTQPTFIQTVTKRGYRLLAPVEPASGSAPPQQTLANGSGDASETVEQWTGPTEFDNVRIVRLLGHGSMGVVHLAQETNLERLVAIKTLRGVIATDERAIKRFRREASAAARIDHPNVTSVFRLGTLQDGTPYLVMQYVRGRTLTALMASSGNVSMDHAVAIISQLAEALAAAHRERIIHRDVKPGNVLIEQDTNQAILSDFGIAGIQETGTRIATRLTLHGEVLGDARYISPEQARGDPPTPASDIYSLGIIAYELLTGAYPYRDDGNDISAHLNAEANPLASHRSDIPASVERIVMQALAKNADERPTAEQLIAVLAAGPADVELEVAPTTGTGLSPRQIGIALAVLAAGAVAFLLLR